MSSEQILAIAFSCIVSAGGIGGVIIAFIKFFSDFIADKLSVKYENKLDKTLEKYKTELSKKEYVSKTRFDAEFSIYRDLSVSFCTMVKDISVMIPEGFNFQLAEPEGRKNYENECYKNANNSTVRAQDSLYASAAFIPEDFFIGYEEILSLCKQQLNVFAFRYNVSSFETKNKKRELKQEDYKRTEEINKKWISHNEKIRDYLTSLDVL